MASSSSSITLPQTQIKWNYDVFLSFRCPDTRNNFVSHLKKELDQKRIETFIDDEELQVGKAISPELMKAIKESRVSIVVLSENYASSSWCLDELLEILDRHSKNHQQVYPIFYRVAPSDVQDQKGNFGKGFDELVSKHQGDEEKVQRWKNALKQVAGLKGSHYTNQGSESKFIEDFVKENILNSIPRKYLNPDEHLVGMDSRLEKVIELLELELDDVRVVGIWGMGGIGKTTLAKAVCDCDCISSKFQGCSFIENGREDSESKRLKSLEEVCRKKVLVVFDDLDDVDCLTQVEKLVGQANSFNSGGRIIITTRDKHNLDAYGVQHIYEVKGLNEEDSIKLLSCKAFGTDQQKLKDYQELLPRAVEYVQGVPLALKVLGSSLKGRGTSYWESELEKLKEFPLKGVMQVLKISYDALDWEQQQIFLYIVCCFRLGDINDINDITKILDSCGFRTKAGIEVLVDKSFLTILWGKWLSMHDLIRQLGKNIVWEECPEDPGKRSHIFLNKDVEDVLTDNTGTEKIRSMVHVCEEFESCRLGQLKLSPSAFAKMTNLMIIRISCVQLPEGIEYLSSKLRYLEWHVFPMKHMPSTFQPSHLVQLHMTFSDIEQLWNGPVDLGNLRIVDLSYSENLTMSPDFTKAPNLGRLNLERCSGLKRLHQSTGALRKLTYLNLGFCSQLESLPSDMHLESLQLLYVSSCGKLEIFLENFGPMKYLLMLHLNGTGIRELPQSFGDHTNLVYIDLSDCKNLTSIPDSLGQLKALATLKLNGCSKVDKLPEEIGGLECLKFLEVRDTAIRQLPSATSLPKSLEELTLNGIETISWSSLFPSFSQFESLTLLDLSDCNLESIPTDICCCRSLEYLNLSGNKFESLPARMSQLSKLSYLSLHDCVRLKELPELSSDINGLDARNCYSLRTISSPDRYKNIRRFDFRNCFELVGNILTDVLPTQFQVKAQREKKFIIIFPGSEIPEWFSCGGLKLNRRESCVSFQLFPNWYNSRFLGIAFSFVLTNRNSRIFPNIWMWFPKRLGNQKSTGKDFLFWWNEFFIDPHHLISDHVYIAYFPKSYLQDKFGMDQLDQLHEDGIEFEACFEDYWNSDSDSDSYFDLLSDLNSESDLDLQANEKCKWSPSHRTIN